MDEIRIRELQVYAYHGVFPEENEKGQFFYVNATLYTDTRKAGLTDELRDATDYGQVCHLITRVMTENTWKLIERAAEVVAEEILLSYPLVKKVNLEIRKPDAPVGLPFASVSVAVERGWHKAYLAVGSNMGDKQRHIAQALDAIKASPKIKVGAVSDWIVTKPYGVTEQEDFLNGALEVDTLFTPVELLDFLHLVEAGQGRERTLRWGPRTLDLDILFYDRLVYEDDRLIIPHVDMQNRDFVLQPMAQIAPNLRHPVLGKTINELWKELDSKSHNQG